MPMQVLILNLKGNPIVINNNIDSPNIINVMFNNTLPKLTTKWFFTQIYPY